MLPFMKMHGLGNDFVVFDARSTDFEISDQLVRGIAHRHFGVGFDQMAVISTGQADAHLTFYNSDGSEAGACGNATRCIARYLMTDLEKDAIRLTTARGVLHARKTTDGLISVNMGQALLNWDEVPLSEQLDTLELPIEGRPTATGMGNPHCTFFVENADAIPLEEFGSRYEHHPLFLEATNVQVAHLIDKDHIRMRVWERGVGITLASGSSSCATAVAAARRGLTGKKVQIDLDGGRLWIDWSDDGVWMTGETMHVFTGELSQQFLESLS